MVEIMWREEFIKPDKKVNRDGLMLIEDIIRERFVVKQTTDLYQVEERIQNIVDQEIDEIIEIHMPNFIERHEKQLLGIRQKISGRSKVKWYYHKWTCKGTKWETRKAGVWFALKIVPIDA